MMMMQRMEMEENRIECKRVIGGMKEKKEERKK